MCYVRNDGNIVIKIKQLIFKRAGKPSESVLEGFALHWHISAYQIVLYKIISKCYINTKMNSSRMK